MRSIPMCSRRRNRRSRHLHRSSSIRSIHSRARRKIRGGGIWRPINRRVGSSRAMLQLAPRPTIRKIFWETTNNSHRLRPLCRHRRRHSPSRRLNHRRSQQRDRRHHSKASHRRQRRHSGCQTGGNSIIRYCRIAVLKAGVPLGNSRCCHRSGKYRMC